MTAGGLEETSESFDDFYRQSFHALARLACVLTGDAAAAEDLAQESLLRVRDRFDSLDSPPAYTRTVLINLCRKRERQVRQLRVAHASLRPPVTIEGETGELLDLVDRLPYRQRAVLVLRYFEGLNEAEIAAAIGCRPGTVKSLASRGLAQLRKDLEQ